MGEALFEREQLPFARAEIALGKDRDDTSRGEAALDVAEERGAAALGPIDGDDAARRADEGPERAVLHHRSRVGEVVDPRLGREQQEDADRVHPAEVVRDEDVGGARNAIESMDVEAEEQPEERPRDQPHHAERRARLAPDGQHVRRGDGAATDLGRRLEAKRLPPVVERGLVGGGQARGVQRMPAVVAAQVGLGARGGGRVADPQQATRLQGLEAEGKVAVDLSAVAREELHEVGLRVASGPDDGGAVWERVQLREIALWRVEDEAAIAGFDLELAREL